MHIWELLIDYIFPPTTEEKLIRDAKLEDIRNEYIPSRKNDIYYFCSYKRKLIKAAITAAKFSHNKNAVRLLGNLLTFWINENTNESVLLIPIPLHPTRERERGYNQVTLVLKQLNSPKVIVNEKLLCRKRHTTPQTKLDKRERGKNIIGAFSVNNTELQKILSSNLRQVIICDDVYTTGSTLMEAKKTLSAYLPKDCRLTCLAWAH